MLPPKVFTIVIFLLCKYILYRHCIFFIYSPGNNEVFRLRPKKFRLLIASFTLVGVNQTLTIFHLYDSSLHAFRIKQSARSTL